MISEKLLDTGLPLVPFLGEICESLDNKGAVIVRADPGSGKSTLLPLSLLERTEDGSREDCIKSGDIKHPARLSETVRRNENRIILLEPRRAAALGIAARMADLIGEKSGERVGYAVRLERKISPRTKIEVMTEGLFIRRLQANPSLDGISTVIFDEFHERSVMTDLALAFLLDTRRMGSKTKILIMSATMNAGNIAAFINRVEGRTGDTEISVFDIPGRVFPVEIEYHPLPKKAPPGIETGNALTTLLEKRGQGDTLVFLPGRREIADAEKILRSWEKSGDFEILPLHGGLPLAKQREITAPGRRDGLKKRRVILATNIAESALTIPGITLVVDSGYVRLERFHLPTALNRLSLEEASLMSSEQRAGRAGRLGPGRCIRLWEKSSPRSESTDPEIRRIDLSGTVLECLLWGIRARTDLPWLEIPQEAAWERALELLSLLGAIDAAFNPAVLGKETVKLGLEPRLGILCLAGKEKGCPGLACASAAILSDRDGSMINGDGDFRSRLALIRNAAGLRANTGKPAFLSWLKNVSKLKDDLLRRLNLRPGEYGWTAEDESNIGELLAAAFPDRIAMRQESGCFRFVSGREARVEGPLENFSWLVAAEVDAGERAAFIRLGAPLSEESSLRILKKETLSEIRVEWKGLVPRTVESRRAGRLLLGEVKRLSSGKEAAADFSAFLREKGLGVLPWEDNKAAPGHLLERIRFFVAHENGNAHNASGSVDNTWTDEALIQSAAEWLVPFLKEPDKRDNNVLSFSLLISALENRFGWDRIPILDREAPKNFLLPSGRQRQIDYASGEPVLAIRIQECFGISVHPRFMNVPLVFHLLSPANRPVQITSDITGFWSGSYADVRKDMKGRYPKHNWPADPTVGFN